MTTNNQALKQAGLKITSPRLKILDILRLPEYHHVSAEDLYKKILSMGEEIALATVYRVLSQFDAAGIVTRHNFENGKSVFELAQQQHHDHLICLSCGRVMEFQDELIKQRQFDIAKQHDICLTNHSLYLYGHCTKADCQNSESSQASSKVFTSKLA